MCATTRRMCSSQTYVTTLSMSVPRRLVRKLVLALPVLVEETKMILQLAWFMKPRMVCTASGRIKLASSTKSRLKSCPRIPFVLWLEANTMVLRAPSGKVTVMFSPLTWSTRASRHQRRRRAWISSNTGSVALRMWAV